MGELRPNGDGSPPDDNSSRRGGLPGFPAEWGPVIIPDDASELDRDAQIVQQELRRQARRDRLREVLGIGPETSHTALTLPVVIMALTVLATLVGFLAVLWQHHSIPGQTSTRGNPPPATVAAPALSGGLTGLSGLVVPDANGANIRLGSLLPVVILVVDRSGQCDCATLIAQVAANVPAGVTVVPVSATTAGLPVLTNVHPVADPEGVLRARLIGDAAATASGTTAILVDRSGAVVATKPAIHAAGDLASDLPRLAG